MRSKYFMTGVHGLCLIAALSWTTIRLGCNIGVQEIPAVLFFGQFPLLLLNSFVAFLMLAFRRPLKLDISQSSSPVLWATMAPGLISLALMVIAVWPIGTLWGLLPFLYFLLVISMFACALKGYAHKHYATALWWLCIILSNGLALAFVMSRLLWGNDAILF